MNNHRLLKGAAVLALALSIAVTSTTAFAAEKRIETTKAIISPKIGEAPQYPYFPQGIPPAYMPWDPNFEPDEVYFEDEIRALSLYVNGKYLSQDLYFQGSTLLLPLRSIAKRSSWTYKYSRATVTLTNGDDLVWLSNGSSRYNKNGEKFRLSGYCEVIGDSVYAPWDFFTNALGMNVKIGTDSVKVTTKSSSENKRYTLKLNGMNSDVAPYYKEKTLMLPLRFVVETLGYRYTDDTYNGYVIFSAKNIDTFIYLNQNFYPVDNQYIELESAPVIKNGVIYVPASFVTEALKCKIQISGRTISIIR